jgi:hypothetical protein
MWRSSLRLISQCANQREKKQKAKNIEHDGGDLRGRSRYTGKSENGISEHYNEE